jgi:hypothetical protein
MGSLISKFMGMPRETELSQPLHSITHFSQQVKSLSLRDGESVTDVSIKLGSVFSPAFP